MSFSPASETYTVALAGLHSDAVGRVLHLKIVACQRGAPQGAPHLLRIRPEGAMRVEIVNFPRDDGQIRPVRLGLLSHGRRRNPELPWGLRRHCRTHRSGLDAGIWREDVGSPAGSRLLA